MPLVGRLNFLSKQFLFGFIFIAAILVIALTIGLPNLQTFSPLTPENTEIADFGDMVAVASWAEHDQLRINLVDSSTQAPLAKMVWNESERRAKVYIDDQTAFDGSWDKTPAPEALARVAHAVFEYADNNDFDVQENGCWWKCPMCDVSGETCVVCGIRGCHHDEKCTICSGLSKCGCSR